MTKSERLDIERQAREALCAHLSCRATSKKLAVTTGGPVHEFDIFEQGIIIGGVTTGTFYTTKGNPNTSMRDRVVAELFWLLLWPGDELRVLVLTDNLLATWLLARLEMAPLLRPVHVYHYEVKAELVVRLGCIGSSIQAVD